MCDVKGERRIQYAPTLTPIPSPKVSQNQVSRTFIFSDNSIKCNYCVRNYIYSGRRNFSASSHGKNSVLISSKNLGC